MRERVTSVHRGLRIIWAGLACAFALPAFAALPPPPVPPENPITEPKRVLGKILFWDEQLSADNTIACGTCHRPAAGGTDPRSVRHPGADGKLGTEDDVHGSPGMRRHDRRGNAVKDAIFGHGVQSTDRNSMSFFTSQWSQTNFWDGRAGSTFTDPVTGKVAIAHGGALENQAIGPILNAVEMSRDQRAWPEVVKKLERAKPLALATRVPRDAAAAIARAQSYPALFTAAFGDATITPTRIAFALATYERTLIPDQTPYDLNVDKGVPLKPAQQTGLAFFETERCMVCHTPPLFTNNEFFNVGLRPAHFDQGRRKVTGDRKHAGQMKVPSLRNVGLRPRFMHSGELTTLDEVIDLYARPRAERNDLPDGSRYQSVLSEVSRESIKTFLSEALTDPRVAAETFPFDRPILRSERHTADKTAPAAPAGLRAILGNGELRLGWRPASDDTGVADYVVRRNGEVIAFTSEPRLTEEPKTGVYTVEARDAVGNTSKPAWAIAVGLVPAVLGVAGALATALLCVLLWRRRRARPAEEPAHAV